MKTITVKPNQTIYDIAVENYGTCEAIGEILKNNPILKNEDNAKTAVGIDAIADKSFYFDLPLKADSTLLIDTDSRAIKNSVVREINTDVTTFNL